MTVIALLSAIGVVLMSILQIPYPVAPFLKIEFSDLPLRHHSITEKKLEDDNNPNSNH